MSKIKFIPDKAAEHIFKRNIIGKNIMTPEVVGYYMTKNNIIEFSYGVGLGTIFYGVTVLTKNGKPCRELCKSSFNREEIVDYINSFE